MDADKSSFMNEIRKHPLNAKGKYYVDQDECTCCMACVDLAINNFTLNASDEFLTYVFKQPKSLEEEIQCKEALNHCPHEAIHDDGSD